MKQQATWTQTRGKSPSPNFHSMQQTEKVPSDSFSSYQPDRVVSVLKAFLKDVDYSPTGINSSNQELEDSMREFITARELDCPLLEKILPSMVSIAQLCHPTLIGCEEEYGVIHNVWFCIYVGEKIWEDPIPFNEFGRRLLTGQRQLDPVLTALAEVLKNMWQIYDPLIASLILNATLQFVSYTYIETQLEKKRLVRGEYRFAWYLCDATGMFDYGLLGFTKKDGFSGLDLIQALPNFRFWFTITNDLLSFHKEELKGETRTYLWARAQIENKSRYEIHEQLIGELKAARQIVYATMENINQKAVGIWKAWEKGYIEWHLTQPRYRLKDLDLDHY